MPARHTSEPQQRTVSLHADPVGMHWQVPPLQATPSQQSAAVSQGLEGNAQQPPPRQTSEPQHVSVLQASPEGEHAPASGREVLGDDASGLPASAATGHIWLLGAQASSQLARSACSSSPPTHGSLPREWMLRAGLPHHPQPGIA
jgi:hypothetical protein